MSWTEERIDKLKELWSKGMTASQIAEELGGVSRNAVIGKAHRLDLQSRPSPVKGGDSDGAAKPEPKKAAPRAAPAPKAAAPAPVAPPPAPPVQAKAPPPAPVVDADDAEVNAPMPLPNRAGNIAANTSYRSIGPGGFIRQSPGEQAPPSTPAPPRRLVPAKPSPEIAGKTSLLDLNDRICKWPLGHPGEPDFHFCGDPVNPGFPYCVAHCGQAFQAQMPRRDRRPPPPMPFGGPRVR
jgi:GcrA cell cycle regulator